MDPLTLASLVVALAAAAWAAASAASARRSRGPHVDVVGDWRPVADAAIAQIQAQARTAHEAEEQESRESLYLRRSIEALERRVASLEADRARQLDEGVKAALDGVDGVVGELRARQGAIS